MAVKKQIRAFGSDKYLIRRLFRPKSGVWFCADAAQIEFRLFVHYANAARLLQAYTDDPWMNYHKFVQKMVVQFRPDASYDDTKTLNFSKLYATGKDNVARQLKLPRAESDLFVQRYDMAFPEVGELLKTATGLAEARGWVKTMMGRRCRFPTKDRTYKALNGVIQGTAADIMKRKIIELHNERKRTGLTLRFTVHDEVNGDVPDAESARLVSEVLNRQSFDTKVPILWETGTASNWAEAKS